MKVIDRGDARVLSTILHWPHTRYGAAHCLARLVIPPAPEQPVAVLSELSSNPDLRGVTMDFPAAATAFGAIAAAHVDVDLDQIRWISHHGRFSTCDDDGRADTFTEVSLARTANGYAGGLGDQHLLTAQEARFVDDLGLEPVGDVVAQLGDAT